MQQTQHWTEHFQLSVYYVRNFEILKFGNLIFLNYIQDNGNRQLALNKIFKIS